MATSNAPSPAPNNERTGPPAEPPGPGVTGDTDAGPATVQRPKRLLFGPSLARWLMILAGVAVVACLTAPTANADVNTAYNGYGVGYVSNCTIYSGDWANTAKYAVGDTTVRCGSHHNISVYTQLFRNGSLVENSLYPYMYYTNATDVHDAATGAYGCSVRATWETVSYVWIDNSGWRYVTSPRESFQPCA